MSGLPETFPCPWCGMSYPAKPVLVGKSVRCKGCRNGFVLQADGVATKIQEPAPAAAAAPPAPAAVPQASAVAPRPAAPPPKPPEPAAPPRPVVPPPAPAPATPTPPPVVPVPRPVIPVPRPPAAAAVVDAPADEVMVLPRTPTPPPAARASERIPKRKTEALEAARAQMAAQLAEVAHKAANSEVVKREERKSERIAKSGVAAPAKDGKRAARNAILTGEGERRHREMRLMWMWLGIAAAVVLLLMFVLSMRSTTRSTLELYAAPVSNDLNRYPALGEALRARAWLAAAQSMPGGPVLAADLSDATFGAERTISIEALRTQLTELKGLRLDSALGLWLAPADLAKARTAAAGHTGLDAIKAVAAARLRHVVHSQLVAKLALSEDDAVVVLDLLTGTAPRDGEPITSRMLDQGELPDAVVVRPFSGRRGDLIVDIGRPPYKPVRGPYAGSIMRFEGAKWPIGWRVLHLNQVK